MPSAQGGRQSPGGHRRCQLADTARRRSRQHAARPIRACSRYRHYLGACALVLTRTGQRDGVGGLFDAFGGEAEDPVLAGHVRQGPDALLLQPDLPAAGGREPLGVAGGYLLVALDEIVHALLVAREGVTIVAIRGAQLAGQDVGPDQGEAASLAGQRRRAVAGVAGERDPSGRPVAHADLANGIKVEVRGLPHGREQPRHLPALSGKRGGEEVLLLAAVTVVDLERPGGEKEDRPRLTIASRAGDSHRLAGGDVRSEEQHV